MCANWMTVMGGISVLSKNADYLPSDSNKRKNDIKDMYYTVFFEVVDT